MLFNAVRRISPSVQFGMFTLSAIYICLLSVRSEYFCNVVL
jgi:hypothetical protein